MDGSKSRILAAALFVGLIVCATLAPPASGAALHQVAVREVQIDDNTEKALREDAEEHHQQPQAAESQTAPRTTESDSSGRVAAEQCEDPVITRDPFQSLFDDLFWTPAINSLFTGPPVRRSGQYIPRAVLGDVLSGMGSRIARSMGEGHRSQVDSVYLRAIANDEKAAVFAMKLAGVPRENITVSVDSEGLLMVDARYNENVLNGAEQEYSYVAQRQLPFGVNAAEVSAEYKDGLLKITVPKPSGEHVTKVSVQ